MLISHINLSILGLDTLINVKNKISFIRVKRLQQIYVLSSLHILSVYVPMLLLVHVYTFNFNSQEALEGLLTIKPNQLGN